LRAGKRHLQLDPIRGTLYVMQRAVNATRGTVLCANVEEAQGTLGRGRGLMGRAALGADAGMLIGAGLVPMIWIHTFFMRFAIDLVFLDRSGRIVCLMPNVRPWRVTPPVFGARCVLELESGAAHRNGTTVGDEVRLEKA
jgi:uncharacterized protein